jgi:hypothetical protein
MPNIAIGVSNSPHHPDEDRCGEQYLNREPSLGPKSSPRSVLNAWKGSLHDLNELCGTLLVELERLTRLSEDLSFTGTVGIELQIGRPVIRKS